MRVFFIAVAILCSQVVQSQNQPKLIVGIVVDQMRADYIYRYWDVFEENGFKRLINDGYFCKNAHFNYVPTYTGPGHASIYTGATPMNHGIIANSWYKRKSDNFLYCVADSNTASVGCANENGKMSPRNLLAPTLGDAIRISSQFQGKSIGISLKDRGAILPAGHSANAAYWMDYESGKMISSSYYMQDLPKWMKTFNAAKHANKLAKEGWTLTRAKERYTASTVDNTPYEKPLNANRAPIFPYDVEAAIADGGYYNFACTPHGNTLLRLLADQCIVNEKLGYDDHTDLLAISFSSTDMIGHKYGPQSVEIEDTYIKLDFEISQLLESLDNRVGEGNYLLFLTADHAAAQVPSYLGDHKIPAGYIDSEKLLNKLREECKKKFGQDFILSYSNQQIFINHKMVEEAQQEWELIISTLREAALAYSGVANAIDIKKAHRSFSSNNFSKMAAMGWNPKRSGDIAVQYLPGWMAYANRGTTHGSSYNYDSHVPLIFRGGHSIW